MSLSRTSTRAGSRAGHVAIRGSDSWYADGKQNRAIGNTIAFKEQDYRNILNGNITVRVLRLANKSGQDLPIANGGQPVTADDWKAERRESQFAQNAESFMEKADELQAEILKRAREQSADLLRNNGLTVEALMNRASVEIDVQNPLSVDEITSAFERLIKPDFDRQAEETAALLYAQLKEDVGTEQARAMFNAYLPKVQSLYNEKAREELGKIIDERFNAIVEKGNIQGEASDNYLNALKAQVLAGTLAPDEAMRKMQRFQEGITNEIKRQIAAIDAFLSSDAAKIYQHHNWQKCKCSVRSWQPKLVRVMQVRLMQRVNKLMQCLRHKFQKSMRSLNNAKHKRNCLSRCIATGRLHRKHIMQN